MTQSDLVAASVLGRRTPLPARWPLRHYVVQAEAELPAVGELVTTVPGAYWCVKRAELVAETFELDLLGVHACSMEVHAGPVRNLFGGKLS